MIDAVLGKFYKYIILGLIIFIFGYVFMPILLLENWQMLKKLKLKQ